ncbi:MAG: cupin domain-containing protein [Pseudomonadota bacterium]|nr:cupin domain-containing protein [Pseudomonadota bacterium]
MRKHPFHRTSGHLTALLCCISPFTSVAADPGATTSTGEQTVTVIKTPPEILTRQKLPNFVGISAETVGARGLSMNLVVIPPGAAAEPHFHKGFESAVYVLEGRVETRYGPGLKESVITEAGDFLFIPPDVPHQPINLNETEAARAIVVRNDPNEQEHVILYEPGHDE